MTTEQARIQLRVWRARNEMRQGTLADRLQISQSHLSAIEAGTAAPGRDVAARIEEVTGIAVREWSNTANEAETIETEAIR